MTNNPKPTVIESIPHLAGFVFSLATAVQFLDTELTVGAIGYTFDPAHSFVVSLAALVVVFASSHTRDFGYLESWEQVLTGVTLAIMTAHQFVPTVATAIQNNNPHAGAVVFGLGLGTWTVLSR
jgi:hypothetical protein